METTLKEKTAKGLFWGGISNGVQQIMQIIFGIIMLYLLHPGDYGIVGMLSIFTAIALVVQDSGFGTALVNKKNVRHEDYNAVFWFSSMISLIMYLCLFFVAPLIAKYFNVPELLSISRVLFLSFVIGGVGVAHQAFIIRELMVKEKAKIEIYAFLISGIAGIILAFYGYAYWAIVIQNVVYFLVSIIIRLYYVPWKPTLNLDLKPLKTMFSFSVKLLFTSIFMKITENIFSVILGRYYTKEQVGFYSQGYKWSNMGSSLITCMVGNIALPVLSRLSDDKERQRNALRKMFRFGAFVSFPLILGLAFIGGEFLQIVGKGDKWLPALPFLQLFCIWNSVYFLWTLYINLLLSHGKSNIFMKVTIFVGILQLLAIALTFRLGIFPMVIAYISVFFIGLLIWHYYTKKLIQLRLLYVIKDISPYLLTTLGAIFITWFLTKGISNLYLLLFAKIIIVAILYICVMKVFNSKIFMESYNFIKSKKE
jgi:O-antigen/teichoic acid export membrane protein